MEGAREAGALCFGERRGIDAHAQQQLRHLALHRRFGRLREERRDDVVVGSARVHECVDEPGIVPCQRARGRNAVDLASTYVDPHMPAASELVAAGRSDEEVERIIGADWLVYQDLRDLVESVRHQRANVTHFDTSCFSGEYVTGDVTRAYLSELERARANAIKAERDHRVRHQEFEDDGVQVASGL